MSTFADSPQYSCFFGVLGVTASMVLSAVGAAFATAKSGLGMADMALIRPEMLVKGLIPVVMAGVIGIYGLVVSVVIAQGMHYGNYSLYRGFTDLGAGLSVGLSGLASGFATGVVADSGLRSVAREPRTFTGFLMILIFAGAMGLYGLIVGLVLNSIGPSD